MIVVVIQKRRRLRHTAVQDHTEILRLRGILRMQGDRIGEVQDNLVMEQE